ncbi:hypothetical protein HPB51_002930 [Rhipicephalus microplus]|uniref:SUMO-activating enzyme subunit 1 n=1 Tax=Rhipicephalus microplus TaxID=6941 RepID=A0A9J6DT60_RHIMP|nr:hypothetical protein HPB51_002930 [Rhipicephalus microplus]
MTASFKHLRDLHKEESPLLLKSGYGLTSKALNTSSFERQDVKLVLQVFNPHVAEALAARKGHTDFQHATATAEFIKIILRWWSIINVKTPSKGFHHRNVYEEPMSNHTDDPKASFLSAFITWLDVWEFYRHDTGVVTQETLSALRLSAQSLLALVKYCVSELHFKYILLGKVQTDPLESRFGQYRQMAGGQYDISVRQLCETEGKIHLENALPRMSNDDLRGIEDTDSVRDAGTSFSVHVSDTDLDELRAQMPVIGYVGPLRGHKLPAKEAGRFQEIKEKAAQSGSSEQKSPDIDESFYSRQLYVLGRDAMARMAQSDVLISGMGGLGIEIAKNIVLAGVRSVTIHDEAACTAADLSSQYFLSEDSVGQNRASASETSLAQLNQYVQVTTHMEPLTNDFLKKFSVVVLTETPLEAQLSMATFTHENDIPLIVADTRGLAGQIFCDFGDTFRVLDPDGETPRVVMISSISEKPLKESLVNPEFSTCDSANANRGAQLHLGFQVLHAFQEAHQRLPLSWNMTDAAEVVQMAKEKNALQTNPLSEVDERIITLLCCVSSGSLCPVQSVIGSVAAQEVMKACSGKFTPIHQWFYFDAFECLPQKEAVSEVYANAMELTRYDAQARVFGSDVVTRLLGQNYFVRYRRGAPPTMAPGGSGSRLLRGLPRQPLDAGPFWELVMSWSQSSSVVEDPDPRASRDTATAYAEGSTSDDHSADNVWVWKRKFPTPQLIVVTDLVKCEKVPLPQPSLVLRVPTSGAVGAGAVGCELLKNFAMMGLGAACGSIHVTDMDVVERSNLNRQFLFRTEDIDNLNTVSDVIRHCRTFEALKTRRITPKFGRLANVTTVASVDASPQTDLSATIRQIVREELLRHEEQTRYAVPRCASVAFRDAVCASPPATWQHSVNAADCNSYRHDPHYGQTEQRHYDSIDRRFDQHPRDVRPRRPSTAYDTQGEGMSYSQPVAAVEYFNQRPEVRPLPVCYNCGTPGHIARYCNRRRAFSNGQSGSFMQHGGRAMDTNRPGNTTFEGYFREEGSRHFPLDSYSGEQERYRNRYRSPASERTLTPPPAFRASRSPSPRRRVTSSSPRRRFASPPPGN